MTPEKLLNLFRVANIYPSDKSKVLDFGCGAGNTVQSFRGLGMHIEGCDIQFKKGPYVERLSQEGIIKRITLDPYKLPYENNTFDFAFSNQVFEHVMDYDCTLAEFSRIMKPGSVSVHTFPSRWRIIEAHTGTPLGGRFKNYPWVSLWAHLGLNKRNNKDLKPNEVADLDYKYLNNCTNYLTGKELKEKFAKYNFSLRYINDMALPLSSSYIVSKIGTKIPGFPYLTRIIVARFIIIQLNKEV